MAQIVYTSPPPSKEAAQDVLANPPFPSVEQDDLLVLGNSLTDTRITLTGDDFHYSNFVPDAGTVETIKIEFKVDGVFQTYETITGLTVDLGQLSEAFQAHDKAGALNLVFGDADTATGGSQGDYMFTGGGADQLDGKLGADTMDGGAGNDLYFVDTAGDAVVEAAGGGTDTVAARASYVLGAGVQVESLRTSNNGATVAINLAGNEFGQKILGNAGANVLNGRGGIDTLTGLGGHDAFVFDRTPGATNYDHITDFAHGVDKIRLDHTVFTALPVGALAATAFKDIASAAEDSNDRVLYKHTNGALYYDVDGHGGAAPQLIAILDNHPATITASDFLIIA